MRIALQHRHHHVTRQQARPSAFRKRDIDERHDRSAQIENAHQKCRRKRNARQRRPVDDFFHFEHRKAKSLAACAEYAVLTLQQAYFVLLAVSVATIKFVGRGRKCLVLAHANFFTAPISCSGVNGLTTYPLAPCCSPQYLSLGEFFELTRITGIAPKTW